MLRMLNIIFASEHCDNYRCKISWVVFPEGTLALPPHLTSATLATIVDRFLLVLFSLITCLTVAVFLVFPVAFRDGSASAAFP